MKMLRYPLIIGVVLLIFLPVAVLATMIIDHVGNADPTLESPAWAKSGTLNGSAVNDGGTPAWKTQDTNTLYVSYNYVMPESTFNDPTGWTYSIRTRMVSSLHSTGVVIGMGFWINEINDYFLFTLVGGDTSAENGLWLWTGGINYTLLKNMDTTSAYHTYQVIYNPGQTDRVGVYVDGVKVAEVLDSQVPAAYAGNKYVAWGITGTTALGEDGNWNYAAFETGQHLVPLPPTALLLGSGLLGLAGWRRFRKN